MNVSTHYSTSVVIVSFVNFAQNLKWCVCVCVYTIILVHICYEMCVWIVMCWAESVIVCFVNTAQSSVCVCVCVICIVYCNMYVCM